MKMDDIDDHNHIQMLLMTLLALCSLLLITLPHSHSHHFDYSNCERPFNCGEVSEIFYPFWGKIRPPECGGGEPFQLSCHHANTTILIGSQNFTVKTIDLPQKTMRLVRTDLLRDVCNPQREDTFINPTLFQYPPYNVTVYYDCPHHQSFPFKFTCGNVFSYFAMEYDWQSNDLRWLRQNCKLPLRVPVNVPMEYFDDRGDQNLTHLLDKRFEFDVKYDVSERCINCLGKDGYCSGYDPHTINSCYYCPDGSNALHCSSKSTSSFFLSPFPQLIILSKFLFFYPYLQNCFHVRIAYQPSFSSLQKWNI